MVSGLNARLVKRKSEEMDGVSSSTPTGAQFGKKKLGKAAAKKAAAVAQQAATTQAQQQRTKRFGDAAAAGGSRGGRGGPDEDLVVRLCVVSDVFFSPRDCSCHLFWQPCQMILEWKHCGLNDAHLGLANHERAIISIYFFFFFCVCCFFSLLYAR